QKFIHHSNSIGGMSSSRNQSTFTNRQQQQQQSTAKIDIRLVAKFERDDEFIEPGDAADGAAAAADVSGWDDGAGRDWEAGWDV
ncbi:hypothetical protein BOX15_Mlig003783g2, partial [Macrostomum lignano]